MRTDELDLVRRFAQDGPEPPADVMDRARKRLTGAMATSAEVVPLITSSDTALDRRRRRFVLPAVAAAAVLALAGAAVGVTVSGGGSARPSTGVGIHRGSLAATELDRAARLVADDSTPVPGPGEYLYTETDSATLVALNSAGNLTPPDVTPSTIVGQSASSAPNPNTPDAGATYRVWDETHAQSWVDANDNGQARLTFSTSFFSPQDKSVWQAAGSPPADVATGAPSTASLSASGFPDVTGLPTDPQALLRTLESGAYGAANDPSVAFSAVGELLQDPKDTSAAFRSALYQAAALIPGTEALGTIADHAGQQGQGIGLTKDGVRSELVVDPSSGQLLGTEDVALDPSAASDALIQSARVVPAGTIVSWWSVVDSGIVASVSSTPAPSNGSNS
ncbi:MAG: CU044_5270 family protein [Acidimicrobiales bacterium]